MKNKIWISIAIIILSSADLLTATKSDYVESKINLKNQIMAEMLDVYNKNGQIAEFALPVLKELKDLMKGLPKREGKSIGEVMNTEQADKFGRLSEKQNIFTLQRLFVSKRKRDIEVVENLVELITSEFEERNAQFRTKVTDEERKFLMDTVDLLGALILEKENKAVVSTFVDDGLDKAIGELMINIRTMMESRTNKVEAFQENYSKRRGAKFTGSDLSESEKREYESLVKPLQISLKASCRILGVKVLYTLMTLENRWASEEVVSSAGNVELAGRRMNEFRKGSTEEVQLMVDLVRAINDKFPCEAVKEWEDSKK